VSFSGEIFIEGTNHPGSYGSPIANAKIEVVYEKMIMTEMHNETLVSGVTDSTGFYDLHIIRGATVDFVKIDYHAHNFSPYKDSGFIARRTIQQGGSYANNDFVDTSKAHLLVEVVGRLCDKYLGNKSIFLAVIGIHFKKLYG